jgi:hypothetical protein
MQQGQDGQEGSFSFARGGSCGNQQMGIRLKHNSASFNLDRPQIMPTMIVDVLLNKGSKARLRGGHGNRTELDAIDATYGSCFSLNKHKKYGPPSEVEDGDDRVNVLQYLE